MDANFARHYRVAETMLLESGVEVRLFRKEDALLSEAKERFLAAAKRELRTPG
jgi:hypothetical protein